LFLQYIVSFCFLNVFLLIEECYCASLKVKGGPYFGRFTIKTVYLYSSLVKKGRLKSIKRPSKNRQRILERDRALHIYFICARIPSSVSKLEYSITNFPLPFLSSRDTLVPSFSASVSSKFRMSGLFTGLAGFLTGFA